MFRLSMLFMALATPVAAIDVRQKNAVPSGGKCVNEGDFKLGNHCVKLGGSALDSFQKKTQQDFSEGGKKPEAWCICLHLFEEQGGASTFPDADFSQCSQGALSASQ